MQTSSRFVPAFAALFAALLAHGSAEAHFILTLPASSTGQDGLGDPQKAPPCGDDGSAMLTNIVTPLQAGDTFTVTINETIFHPGHYRISIAPDDPSQLPAEPVVTPDDISPCGSAPIQSPAVFPVLADGVFLHTQPFAEPQSIDITLPDDLTCTNCTLQILQFMSNHGLNNPGGCYYHHCATLSVQGGAAESTSAAGDDTSAGDSATTVTTAEGTSEASNGDGISGGDSGSESSGAGSTNPGSATVGAESGVVPEDTDGDSGCGCAVPMAAGNQLATWFGLIGLAGLRSRRRRVHA